MQTRRRRTLLFLAGLLLSALPLFAGEGREIAYRAFFGADSRVLIWIVAQLHLMFGAFVLGVPIFAVLMEYVGFKTGDARYDRLAHEFTKLLSAAYSTTAALGGLLAFSLFALYPRFMNFLTHIFSTSYFIYALLFFAETFTLYFYYYSWTALLHRKRLHIIIGVWLNIFGTALMLIANAWASFMMTPSGIDRETGQFVGTLWQAIANPLWLPLAIHRLVGNVAFGGLVAGAYAAIKFLGAQTPEDKAHYDWMGYVSNFVGLGALIPLPFAGYYLGREVYSASPVMGNNMMGGAFSWSFIIQAILIGMLFIGGNYYLWMGMHRIPGAERYAGYVKYINAVLIISFAIWLTPHNLPLSAVEQLRMGGQYHPLLKYLGLMSAKNAVINLIILATFFSFLLYRRGNKGKTRPFVAHGPQAMVILGIVGAVCLVSLGAYARSLWKLDPATLDLSPDRWRYLLPLVGLLVGQMAAIVAAILLALRDRGKAGQFLVFAATTIFAVLMLGVYGYIVMAVANPLLRHIAVTQWLILLSCLLTNTYIDIFLFRGAQSLGPIVWGRMPMRSQYVLVLLCITIVMLMGLMGFIRSGLREDWHIYGVMRDTSAASFTPTHGEMTWVVGWIVLIFLGVVAFLFWLSALGERQPSKAEEMGAAKGAQD